MTSNVNAWKRYCEGGWCGFFPFFSKSLTFTTQTLIHSNVLPKRFLFFPGINWKEVFSQTEMMLIRLWTALLWDTTKKDRFHSRRVPTSRYKTRIFRLARFVKPYLQNRSDIRTPYTDKKLIYPSLFFFILYHYVDYSKNSRYEDKQGFPQSSSSRSQAVNHTENKWQCPIWK